eukprot:SAG11_NODE_1594_length_4612_cov_11.187458_6_plen_64_part_00
MAMAFDNNGDGVLQTTERRHLRRGMVNKVVSHIRAMEDEHQIAPNQVYRARFLFSFLNATSGT